MRGTGAQGDQSPDGSVLPVRRWGQNFAAPASGLAWNPMGPVSPVVAVPGGTAGRSLARADRLQDSRRQVWQVLAAVRATGAGVGTSLRTGA